jgi:hypothetical protein
MARTAAINVHVEPSVKRALQRAAAEDGRSVANFIERLLTEHLRERGYLKPDK